MDFNWDKHFKLCIKKQTNKQQKKKNQQKKFVRETVNLCSPNLTKPKKKSLGTQQNVTIFS